MVIGVPKEIQSVANMPGAYARTATQALTNVTHPFIEILADSGLAGACERQPAQLGGINVVAGKLTHKAVAEARAMEWSSPVFQEINCGGGRVAIPPWMVDNSPCKLLCRRMSPNG